MVATLRTLLFISLVLVVFHAVAIGSVVVASWMTLEAGQDFGAETVHRWMSRDLTRGLGPLFVLVPSQLVLIGFTALLTRSLGTGARAALGLDSDTELAWTHGVILTGGTLFILLINIRVAYGLMDAPLENVGLVNIGLPRARVLSGLFALAVGTLLPVFGEELLLRGYVLKRLLQAWNPWAAVLGVTVVSGLMQMSLDQAELSLLPAFYCGVVAWRRGSVVPAMCCRAAYNLAGGLLAFGGSTLDATSSLANVLIVPVVLGAALAFVAANVLLARRPLRVHNRP